MTRLFDGALVPAPELSAAQLDGKIQRMLFELGSLSPRMLSPFAAGGQAGEAQGTAVSATQKIRAQVGALEQRQQSSARRSSTLQAAAAELAEDWSEATDIVSFIKQ